MSRLKNLQLLIFHTLCFLFAASFLTAQEPAVPEDACYLCHIELDLEEDAGERLFVNYINDNPSCLLR